MSAEVPIRPVQSEGTWQSVQVGDHVWVPFPQTLRGKSKKPYRPWSGPFLVIKKLSDVTYKVHEVKNRWRR